MQGDPPELVYCNRGNFIIHSGIAADIRKLSVWVTSDTGPTPQDELSLFPLETAYRTAVAYTEMYKRNGNAEYLEAISQLKGFLITYDQRWKLAGTLRNLNLGASSMGLLIR